MQRKTLEGPGWFIIVDMKKFMRHPFSIGWLLAALVLLLPACQLLPLPVDLGNTLGDLRSGSYSFDLPASFENLNATFYLPDDQGYPVAFDPPSPTPTFANARFRLRYTIDAPAVSGSMYLTPYFAPDSATVFDSRYALGGPIGLVIDGAEHVASGEVSLTAEQLELLKAGRAVMGIRLDAVNLDAANGSGTTVTFSWVFDELVAEVGLF